MNQLKQILVAWDFSPGAEAALAQALLSHAEDAEDHNLPLMVWYGIEPLATNDARFVDLVAEADGESL